MLLKLTFSNTKTFFKTTIQTFKSYFSGGYQKLPKTPPCNPFSCTGSTRGGFATHPPTNHPAATATAVTEPPNLIINSRYEPVIKKQETKKMNLEKDEEQLTSSKCLVTRKLKELEMMDRNNVDLVVDIEEVLDCYSRLTCPVYREIVEKFFVDVYSGSFVVSRVENSVSKKLLI